MGKIKNTTWVMALAAMMGMVASPGHAGTVTTAFAFDGTNGAVPNNGNPLILGGSVYVSTYAGGANDLGTIVSQPTTPGASPTLLYSFAGADGSHPNGSLVADNTGNLYGTTRRGGTNDFGTIFRLAKPHTAGGTWTLTTIHSFACADGAYPAAGVTMGPGGSLYGTTFGLGAGCPAGSPANGTLFKTGPGNSFQIVHAFLGFQGFSLPAEGSAPQSNVVVDPAGNMIGTLSKGFPFSAAGVLYVLSPAGAYKQVYVFTINQGLPSVGNIVRDSAGNVYGTMAGNGNGLPRGAIIYKVAAVTHQISYLGVAQGYTTTSGVTRDNAGNLYATFTGVPFGTHVMPRNAGGVFMVSPSGTTTILANLMDDNEGPAGGVVLDSAGHLWGTSSAGGSSCATASNVTTTGCGTIFEVTP